MISHANASSSAKDGTTFAALGRSGATFDRLETFPKPEGVHTVTATSDEVTAVCPVTGQPDQYTVTIRYAPRARCVESKSLKLYLQSFRNEGIFCEAFADKIADDLAAALDCCVDVEVDQKPRGGIRLVAHAARGGGWGA